MKIALKALKAFAAFGLVATTLPAFADTTGPGAKLYKLSDRWVSVLPEAQVVVVAPPPPAPVIVPEPVVEQGFRPDANYSGACHVTVNPNTKTYEVNETSSTDQVLQQTAERVCLPSERLAIDQGFAPVAR